MANVSETATKQQNKNILIKPSFIALPEQILGIHFTIDSKVIIRVISLKMSLWYIL